MYDVPDYVGHTRAPILTETILTACVVIIIIIIIIIIDVAIIYICIVSVAILELIVVAALVFLRCFHLLQQIAVLEEALALQVDQVERVHVAL